MKIRISLSSEAPTFNSQITEKGKTLDLTYRLYDHRVAQRWAALIKKDVGLGKSCWMNGIFYGRLFTSNACATIAEQLNTLLLELDVAGGRLFSSLCRGIHDQHSLDQIRQLKTHLSQIAATDGFLFPVNYREKLDRLYFLVHRMETSLFAGPAFGTVIGVPFPPTVEPLEPDDYGLFSSHSYFGVMYLDYGTNGVPALDCFQFKLNEKPTLQTTIGSGFSLNFGRDLNFSAEGEFVAWLERVHPEVAAFQPKGIGRIPLGELEMPHLQVAKEREQLLGQLKQMQFIKAVAIIEAKKSATAHHLIDTSDVMSGQL